MHYKQLKEQATSRYPRFYRENGRLDLSNIHSCPGKDPQLMHLSLVVEKVYCQLYLPYSAGKMLVCGAATKWRYLNITTIFSH